MSAPVSASATVNTPKTVRFNTDLNVVYPTYSADEYDRHTIDYVIKRKIQNQVSHEEWRSTLTSLQDFKTSYMVVHSSNVCSIHLLNIR